jgi:hypothetical protein
MEDLTDHPPCHYFLARSHTPSLEGNQLFGKAWKKAYENAFNCDVHCVELDLSDGFGQGTVILHSGTIVTKVFANEVNQVIDCCTFPKDDQGKARVKTPVILLLESYCMHAQRQILFKNCRKNYRTEVEALRNGGMNSFSETGIEKRITGNPLQDFQRHNESPMTQVYPKGSRFDLADYDPILTRNCGYQLVFLNPQTESKPMWLNDALLSLNNGCYYVLTRDLVFHRREPSGHKTLHVTVLCGGRLEAGNRPSGMR